MVNIDDLEVEDILEWLPIDEKVRASQVMYIHWEDWLDGKDWKDGKDWESGKDWYTPQKWVDYFDGIDWVDWKDGKDGRDWIDGEDGKDWKDGINWKDWIEIEWKDIINKINSTEDEYKIDASKIKNLPEFTQKVVWGTKYALNGVPTGWSLWQVLAKRSWESYDMEWVAQSWWGWSWIVETIVPWTNMSVDNTDPANPIVSVENLVLADITDVTATVTEINYVDWVTSDIQTQLNDKFSKSTDDTDDITEWATNKFATATEKTKLSNITVTQPVDLDTLESDTATNNAKVTNATHTGEMAGATVLTADPTLISNKTLLTPLVGTEEVLINDAWVLKKTTAQDIADLWGWGGGWSQPYTALSTDTTITQWNVYWVTASTVDINLTLSDGTSAWQTLTVKKLDSTDYSVFINNANIDWETSIELTIEDESVDLYRTWTTFIIK